MTFLKRISRKLQGDRGMTTAEYAVGTIAAVAFAVVLYRVVQSSAVHDALSSIVVSALHVSL
jgi:Mn2+/Fe2+ NRAMP family transporter